MSKSVTSPPVWAATKQIPGALVTIILVTICAASHAQGLPVNPYQPLDDAARGARDTEGVARLVNDIYDSTLFGHLSPHLANRIVKAELSFQAGIHPAITEKALADAINALGTQLGAGRYTGTNAMQIRLLRVDFMAELPHLVRSYAPRPDKSLVGTDMSPSGALWIGFTLLRQKLTNPAWYGNPEQQNRIVLTGSRRPPKSGTAYRSATTPEPPEVTALVNALTNGLAVENSPINAAFQSFLDIAGFEK